MLAQPPSLHWDSWSDTLRGLGGRRGWVCPRRRSEQMSWLYPGSSARPLPRNQPNGPFLICHVQSPRWSWDTKAIPDPQTSLMSAAPYWILPSHPSMSSLTSHLPLEPSSAVTKEPQSPVTPLLALKAPPASQPRRPDLLASPSFQVSRLHRLRTSEGLRARGAQEA